MDSNLVLLTSSSSAVLYKCTQHHNGTPFTSIVLGRGINVRDEYLKSWTNKAWLDTKKAKLSEKLCLHYCKAFVYVIYAHEHVKAKASMYSKC